MPKGGRRPGAGRPKGSANRVKLVANDIATKALESVDQIKTWKALMQSKDERIRLNTLKYLSEGGLPRLPAVRRRNCGRKQWSRVLLPFGSGGGN